MCNHGEPHTNGSQFYIQVAESLAAWDSKYVVFGRVIEGMRTIKVSSPLVAVWSIDQCVCSVADFPNEDQQ